MQTLLLIWCAALTVAMLAGTAIYWRREQRRRAIEADRARWFAYVRYWLGQLNPNRPFGTAPKRPAGDRRTLEEINGRPPWLPPAATTDGACR